MITNNDYKIGSIVTLKKPHPSQTKQWIVVRLGSDIKIKSQSKENLYIMVSRSKFNKIVKEIVEY